MSSLKKIHIILLILIQFFCVAIYAQENEKKQVSETPWHNIELNIGAYATDVSTQAEIGSNTLGLSLGIDFEKALGLESSSFVFQANGLIRFGKKKKSFAEIGYFSINRTSSKTLEAEIELFDRTFTKGTIISASANVSIITLSYGYSFFKTENFDVGAKFGFFVMPISIGFDAVSSQSNAEASSDQTNFIAPLPVLGLYTNFAFTPKLIMRQSIDIFYVKIANFKGSLTELNMSLEYNAWKHIGFGAGVNFLSLNFEVANRSNPPFDFQGQFGYKLSGALFYVKGYF